MPTGSQLSGVLPETLVWLSVTLPPFSIPPPSSLAVLWTILLKAAVSVPSLLTIPPPNAIMAELS